MASHKSHEQLSLHQHLRISPDDIWLTVAQGVNKHIWFNSESFRHLFIDHEGKKKIGIDARDLLNYKNKVIYGDRLQIIEQLSNAADKQVKILDLKQLFECDFSTSTKASITASKIVLLDSKKAYFRYRMRGGCGIPKVTLEGALTDWLHLQEKVKKLHNLGLNLDFWLSKLEPVIAQFIDTYKGNVDERFWNMVISQIPLSTFGWISSLLPYTKQMCKITNNVIVPGDVPSGLVNVPFEFKLEGEKLHFALNCSAGFLGVRQDIIDNEYVVSPVIGWYIVDQN
ncbi:hypothetical protein C2G38_2145141 [Gigaspora rosea]|uniref:Uncharacterized protein n=1 Tax=Gigaspora rosea TaxID=44941 RepID=A0A397UYI8_9GLOM|nr:hypothetical protein C2G38_2145141 [Gigaspora rosea]